MRVRPPRSPRSLPGGLRGAARGLALLLAAGAPATATGPGGEDYRTLLAGRYAGPVAVPAGGLELELDAARWTLRSGSLFLLEPTSGGAVTGLVFEGDGRFEMAVPDAIELRQLTRFAQDRELVEIDQAFDRMVLRSSSPELVPALGALLEALPPPARAAASPHPLARERHQRWLLHAGHDVDARVIAALRTLGDRYLRADLRLESFGWMTFEYDSLWREEIELTKHQANGVYPVIESWLALDRQEDRLPDGRPGPRPGGNAELESITAEVDLRELGRAIGGARGFGESNPIDARFEITGRYRALRSGLGALLLELHPMARLESVVLEDSAGGDRELDFLRYPIGELVLSRDDREHATTFAVLLPAPALEGDALELRFRHRLELGNFAAGMVWYPRPVAIEDPRVSARVELVTRRYYGAWALGRKVSEREIVGGRKTIFVIDDPTKMIGFTFGRYPHQRRFEEPGLPPITVFGTRGGYLSSERIDEVVERYVLGPVRYYQEELIGEPIPAPELAVTLISAPHGQAFEGLLQIGDVIARKGDLGRAVYGVKALFMAHEVAHQYWGHAVSWSSYRDQWLSEALAEYSALLYLEHEVDDGPRTFRRAIDAYTQEVLGSIRGAYNAFARPGLALLNKRDHERLGPIGHGLRANTHEAPTAFLTLAYRKGALVLHMIRGILRAHTGSDHAFFELLRELYRRQRATTIGVDELRALLAERVAHDWERFFDQWVLSAELPSYRWSWEMEPPCENVPARLHLEVERADVPDEWRDLIPLRLTDAAGRQQERWIEVGAGRHLWLVVEEPPVEVLFNPDFAVLARMSTRSRTRQPADDVGLATAAAAGECSAQRSSAPRSAAAARR